MFRVYGCNQTYMLLGTIDYSDYFKKIFEILEDKICQL